MQACKDRVLAAEVKATLLEDQLARAVEARAAAERLSTKLITQFGAAEAIFAEAKALSLAAFAGGYGGELKDEPTTKEPADAPHNPA